MAKARKHPINNADVVRYIGSQKSPITAEEIEAKFGKMGLHLLTFVVKSGYVGQTVHSETPGQPETYLLTASGQEFLAKANAKKKKPPFWPHASKKGAKGFVKELGVSTLSIHRDAEGYLSVTGEPAEPVGYVGPLSEASNAPDSGKAALDVEVGGDHYKNFPIQPVVFCQVNRLPACETSIVKYICRWREKDGRKDLLKARHYIDLLLQIEDESKSIVERWSIKEEK